MNWSFLLPSLLHTCLLLCACSGVLPACSTSVHPFCFNKDREESQGVEEVMLLGKVKGRSSRRAMHIFQLYFIWNGASLSLVSQIRVIWAALIDTLISCACGEGGGNWVH